VRRALIMLAAVTVGIDLYLWYSTSENLDAEIHEWLDSARGRFETWAAERDRDGDH
jgi:hypothetical protein